MLDSCSPLPGEVREILHEVPPPVAGVQDDVQARQDRRLLGTLHLQHRGHALDRLQDVVHVVGDPSREASEAVQLLGMLDFRLELAPLLLVPLPFRDVLEDRRHHPLVGA